MGTIYALLALGYSLIFGVLTFINFAHGDVAMCGTYIAWYLIARLHFGFLPACLIAIFASILVGTTMEKIGYKPIRNAPRLAAVIVSMGFSFVLSTAVQILWGTEPQQMGTQGNISTWIMGNITFNSVQLWVLFLAVALMISLELILHKTKIGMAMRAVALDKETSGLMGVNVNHIISFTFAIGSGLGTVSAIMMSAYYGALYPGMGTVIGMKGFAAVVLGGVGSIPGAMLGGILMGVIESLAGTLFNAQVRDAVAFIVLIVVLLFRPAGLLGREVVKE